LSISPHPSILYPLSLHDALPIYLLNYVDLLDFINNNLDKKITLDLLEKQFFVNKYYLSHTFKRSTGFTVVEYITHKRIIWAMDLDRKSTRLNSSHVSISYAVFCL